MTTRTPSSADAFSLLQHLGLSTRDAVVGTADGKLVVYLYNWDVESSIPAEWRGFEVVATLKPRVTVGPAC